MVHLISQSAMTTKWQMIVNTKSLKIELIGVHLVAKKVTYTANVCGARWRDCAVPGDRRSATPVPPSFSASLSPQVSRIAGISRNDRYGFQTAQKQPASTFIGARCHTCKSTLDAQHCHLRCQEV